MAVALTALVVMSCEIAEGFIDTLTRADLEEYAGILFRNNVLLQADMADFAIEFDTYLSLTDEEKQQDSSFHGKTHIVSDGVYQFKDRYMTCVVDTDGKSVWEDGAEWRFVEYSSMSFESDYSGSTWTVWITEPVTLTFSADTLREAMLMVQLTGENENFFMALKAREEGINSWNMSVSGTDVGNNGLKAEYGSDIGTGGLNMITCYVPGDVVGFLRNRFCEGTFNVDIYDGDVKIDWIKATIKKNNRIEYVTSR